jgi:hypothetical protein
MPNKLKDRGLLQIRSVDPELIRQFKIYAVSNGLTHGEAFTKAVRLLLDKAKI